MSSVSTSSHRRVGCVAICTIRIFHGIDLVCNLCQVFPDATALSFSHHLESYSAGTSNRLIQTECTVCPSLEEPSALGGGQGLGRCDNFFPQCWGPKPDNCFWKRKKGFITYFWLNPAPRVESQLPGFVLTVLHSEFLPQFLGFLLSEADQT